MARPMLPGLTLAGAPPGVPGARLPAPDQRPYAELWLTHAASALAVDAEVLTRFVARLRLQGLRLDLSRFVLDLGHARGVLALAHRSSDDGLRELAIVLFEGCQALERRRAAATAALRQA